VTRSEYYEQCRQKAREIREKHGLASPRLLISELKRICKAEGITKIEYRPFKSNRLRGAYFNDDVAITVVINGKLIRLSDPKVFTLAHELKHHLMDDVTGVSFCGDDNEKEMIEIGAEIFAAELIYPESDFAEHMEARGLRVGGACEPAELVHIKQATQTTLSYAGLAKRAVFLEYAPAGAFDGVKWTILEEQLYGVPIYKRMGRGRPLA
jgi:Zn-dependent peptidase ImmA (M78 family)